METTLAALLSPLKNIFVWLLSPGRPDSPAHLKPPRQTGHCPTASGKRSVPRCHHQLRIHAVTPGSQGGTQRRGRGAAGTGSQSGHYHQGTRRVLHQDWAFTAVNLLREDTVCILDVLRLHGGVTADRLPAERQVRLTPRRFLERLSLCISHFITSH